MLLGEVVAPELAPLLLNLLLLLGFVVALGFATLVSTFVAFLVKVLTKAVGWIPGGGPVIAGAANDFGAWFTQGWATAIGGLDKGAGAYWYSLGQEVYWIVNEIKAGANLARIMAEVTVGTKTLHAVIAGVHGVVGIVHRLEHASAVAFRKIGALEYAIGHAETGLIGKAIRHLLQPALVRIGAAENWISNTGGTIASEIDKVIEPDIAALKKRATTLENEAIRVYRDAAGVWHAVNVDAIAAAMVLALPSLGWQWLRCSSLGGVTSARGCGLWSGLDDILGLLVDTALLASACEIIAPLETVVSDVAVPIVDGLTGIGAGLCAGSIGAPAALPVPELYLPPAPVLTLTAA